MNAKRIEDHNEAIREAIWILNHKYFILDTETTGLTKPEMCQVAIRYYDGEEFKSLIRPTAKIEPGATAVHHIAEEDVKTAPTPDVILEHLKPDHFMVIYNAKFDTQVLNNSLRAIGSSLPYNYEVYDLMQIFAKFNGEWNDYYGNYKWIKLEVACDLCGIELEEQDGAFHDAMADVRMSEKLLRYIASCPFIIP